jgi:nitrate reductase gamma subunit
MAYAAVMNKPFPWGGLTVAVATLLGALVGAGLQVTLKPESTTAEIAIMAVVVGGAALLASMYGVVLIKRRRMR